MVSPSSKYSENKKCTRIEKTEGLSPQEVVCVYVCVCVCVLETDPRVGDVLRPQEPPEISKSPRVSPSPCDWTFLCLSLALPFFFTILLSMSQPFC